MSSCVNSVIRTGFYKPVPVAVNMEMSKTGPPPSENSQTTEESRKEEKWGEQQKAHAVSFQADVSYLPTLRGPREEHRRKESRAPQ